MPVVQLAFLKRHEGRWVGKASAAGWGMKFDNDCFVYLAFHLLLSLNVLCKVQCNLSATRYNFTHFKNRNRLKMMSNHFLSCHRASCSAGSNQSGLEIHIQSYSKVFMRSQKKCQSCKCSITCLKY